MAFWKKRSSAAAIEPARLQPAEVTPVLPAERPVVSASARNEDKIAAVGESEPCAPNVRKYFVVVPRGVTLKARLRYDRDIEIVGALCGEVVSPCAILVSRNATCDATIEARDIEIFGTVRGKVRSGGQIVVRSGALVEGDIEAPSVIVEEGAMVSGACRWIPRRAA